jgi:subtilisin family serine protease
VHRRGPQRLVGEAFGIRPRGRVDVASPRGSRHSTQRGRRPRRPGADFSNANADVELAAPGVDVLSTFVGNTYLELSGTSMAAPHASGVAATIFRRSPASNAAAVRGALTSSVDDLGPAGRDRSFGFGRVSLCKPAGGSCAYTGGG